MAFIGDEGTFITLDEGGAMTKKYRDNFLTVNRERKAVFFGRDKLLEILNQTDCKGIRIYYGAEEVTRANDSWHEISLVLVGATADGNNQIGLAHKILDMGAPCPTTCPPNSSVLDN